MTENSNVSTQEKQEHSYPCPKCGCEFSRAEGEPEECKCSQCDSEANPVKTGCQCCS